MKQSIREFLVNFEAGKYLSKDTDVQCEAGWYDWFCKDASLAAKTIKLTRKLKQIINSSKIDQDKMYVFFKNNCPCYGKLYDDFRICSIETGDVVYTICPAVGYDKTFGQAEVWGPENEFKEAIIAGTWEDVLTFFNGERVKRTRESNMFAFQHIVNCIINDNEFYCGGITVAEKIYGGGRYFY